MDSNLLEHELITFNVFNHLLKICFKDNNYKTNLKSFKINKLYKEM